MSMSDEKLRVGHRERLRKRFRLADGAGLLDYEILELLLTFSIPRRDVKPIAKKLIGRFGGLRGILEASPRDWEQVAGLGPLSSTLLRLFQEINRRYFRAVMSRDGWRQNGQSVIHFSAAKLAGLPHEAFMVIYLDAQNEVIQDGIISEGTVDCVAIYPRRVIETALACHASGVILVHNHPSGHVKPSKEDKALTTATRKAGRLLDIRVLDHIIVGKEGYFSFRERGLL
ncbi:MAG: DNA repair protein RadC [Elusimicrobia bacterium]|nr:DNA repair protein RadC [Candidatus Obscuribacterium magneticum]